MPKGCSHAIVETLEKFEDLDNIVVGVSNEFSNVLGVLTSVRENFDESFKTDLERMGINYKFKE